MSDKRVGGDDGIHILRHSEYEQVQRHEILEMIAPGKGRIRFWIHEELDGF